MKRILLFGLLLTYSGSLFATTYYSEGNLTPHTLANWNSNRDGTSGSTPLNFSTSGDIFVIQGTGGGAGAPHTMTSGSTWTTIGSGVTVEVESGATLQQNSNITFPAGSTFRLLPGATFNQNSTNGSNIIGGTEDWQAGSTVVFLGTGVMSNANITGGYPNVIFNNNVSTTNCSSILTQINGNLTVNSGTGNRFFRFAGNTGDVTVTVTGNITIQGTGTGGLDLSSASSSTGRVTLNIGGSLSISAGALTNGSNAFATSSINFTGGSQNVSFTQSGGTVTTTNINWSVANSPSGKTFTLSNALTNSASRTMTVASGATLATAATFTNSGTTTINGNFQINQGGSATGTAFSYGSGGKLIFNNTSGSYGVNNDAYWPSSNGPVDVTVAGAGGITMNVARTVSGVFQYAAGVTNMGNLILNGTSRVNNGGYSASGSPTYGSSSTLIYNVNASYGRNGEWLPNVTSGAGYPKDVQLSNNTVLDLPNGSNSSSFQLAGNLTIDAGSSLQMGSMTGALTTVGNLSNAGTLALSSAIGGDFYLQGNWVNSGTFTPNSRAVFFSGTTAQSITKSGGETFDYLNITNTTQPVSLGSAVAVNNILTVAGELATSSNTLSLGGSASAVFEPTSVLNIGSSGTVNFNSRPVTLQSNASGSATIARIQGTLSNASAVAVQRYIPNKTSRKWSFVSSAVSATVRNSWQQQTFITGSGTGGAAPCAGTTTDDGTAPTDKYNTNGFDISDQNNPTVYSYDGSQTTGNRWTAIANTSVTLTPGKGYRVFVRGTRGASDANCGTYLNSSTPGNPDAVVLSATGGLSNTVNMGNVTVVLDGVSGDHTLLGNPYPSTLDFDLFQADNPEIGNKYWFYSPEKTASIAGTQYCAYNAGVMTNKPANYTNPSSKYIASGQSFFVLKGADASVTFQELHKANNQSGSFRNQSWNNIIRATLNNTANERLDEVVIRFADEPGVTNSSVGTLDSRTMNEGGLVLVSLKGSNRLAIQTRPLSGFVNDTVKLGLVSTAAASYKFSFGDHAQFSTASQIVLRDKYLNTEQDVKINPEYSFSVTSDAASKGDNRFELVFKTSTTLPVSYISITAANKNEKQAEVSWKVPSEKDVLNYAVERSANGRNFNSIGTVNSRGNSANIASYGFTDNNKLDGTSFYRIKATEKDGKISYSPVAKLTGNKGGISITAYPNPVKDKLQLLIQGSSGDIEVRIVTLDGKVVHKQKFSTINSNIAEVNTSALANGVYMVEVMNAKGERVIEKLIKQ